MPAKDPAVARQIKLRYKEKNREKARIYNLAWASKNKEKRKACNDKNCEKNRENKRIQQRIRNHLSPFEKKVRYALFQSRLAVARQLKAMPKPKGRWGEFSNQLSPNERRMWTNFYNRRRRLINPSELVASRMRAQVNQVLKRYKIQKCSTTFNIVGCTAMELTANIERQFLLGMNWENRSDWHIDHIIPLRFFDLTERSQREKAFHFSNLQPLWAADNISKGDKLPNGLRARHYKLADYATFSLATQRVSSVKVCLRISPSIA